MYISIQHFLEKGIKKLEQYEKKFLNNPTDIASFVFGITDELHKLGLEIIKENFEFIDSEIQKDSKRKENWSVERHDMKCLQLPWEMCISARLIIRIKQQAIMNTCWTECWR